MAQPSYPQQNSANGTRVMLSLACAIIIIAGLKAAQPLILPILLAVFFAIVSYPITNGLVKIRLPRFMAVFITICIDCGFLVGLAYLMNFLARDLSRTVVTKYVPLFNEKYASLNTWLTKHNLEDSFKNIQEVLSSDKIMAASGQVFGAAATFISVLVLVLILMTFFLSETQVYTENLNTISKEKGPNFNKALKATADIQRYLGIKTLISFITGLLAFVLCYICQVDFPILWGLVAFALNFIPTIGSIVAAIPPVLLALILNGPGSAFIVMLGYLAINMMLGNFIEPLLLGKQFGIATAVVLLSVLFWGFIWGPIGMLLAVPLTMIMKLALENSHDLHWVSTLISKKPSLPLPDFSETHEPEP